MPKHCPTIKHYRDLSKFTEESFCQDLLAEYQQDGNQVFNSFQDIFSSIVNKHVALKSKIVRADYKPLEFIEKQQCYERS